MKAVIRSLATANPPLYVTGEESYRALSSQFSLSSFEQNLYERVLLHGPIKGRYIGMDSTSEASEQHQDQLIQRFLKFGLKISVNAAEKALVEAKINPAELRGLVVNTCTGYLCPGLSSYIIEAMKLNENLKVADLVGMGCGGAIPNMETACNMLAASDAGPVLSIAVEVCSATLFMESAADAVISNSLFGDGAAAVVMDQVNGNRSGSICQILDFESTVYPKYRKDLQYITKDSRLRNVLTKRVPSIGADCIAKVTRRLLQRNGMKKEDTDFWIVHPGGTQVLDAVIKKLGLKKNMLEHSYQVLKEYGNMSSPSVLFVMERMLKSASPESGQTGVLLTFGAGFSAFGALVRFT